MEKGATYGLLILALWLTTGCLANFIFREVCYEEIGCFDNGPPFYDIPDRPVSWLPESREQIGTTFLLNTRNVPNTANPQELSTYYPDQFRSTNFQASRQTKIITHGFIQGSDVYWMEDMVDAFLDSGDYNVIRVDWQRGAVDIYGIAAANTRIVGAEIALLIEKLQNVYGVRADSFHVIGHSLGAHVAGYAGEAWVNKHGDKIARLTGLDPAGPYFEGMDPVVRLDTSDASYVDAIHTDTDPIYTLGYGMYAPCGHRDYYPNGGRAQPGCDQSYFEFVADEGGLGGGGLWDGTTKFVACNHLRAIDFFIESIINSQCSFNAIPCTQNHDDYNYGICLKALHASGAEMAGNTAIMGSYPSINQLPAYTYGQQDIYQVNTHAESPFCGHQFLFTMKMEEHRKAKDAKGVIFMTLIGSNDQSRRFPLTYENVEYDRGSMFIHMGISDKGPEQLGDLQGLYMEWDYDTEFYKWWNWEGIERPELFIYQILVEDLNGHADFMCATEESGTEPDTPRGYYYSSSICQF